MRFTHLEADDVVLAEFENVELATNADVTRWANEVGRRLVAFGRKVDLLINLDGLRVKAAASREFGRRRAEVLQRYTSRSFRFGGDRSTVTSVLTSAVIERAPDNVHGSYEEALDALRRERAGGSGFPRRAAARR
jgi:hypothetical protein